MNQESVPVARAELPHEEAFGLVDRFEHEISKVIVGQEWLIKGLLLGLFADIPYAFHGGEGGRGRGGCGHLLLEGVPGVAKTLAVVTLAHTIQAPFQRIQLTPDLLPADLIGTRIYDVQAGAFRVQKGPIFSNIVLADEINRATPKTQSALLEAMQERQVTIGDETFRLDDPFWVLATQNPIEQEGVYLLPEAQIDRFAMMIHVDYPTHAEERAMLDMDLIGAGVSPVITPQDVIRIRRRTREVYVDDKVKEYVVRIGRATRDAGLYGRPQLKQYIMVGASPRSYQHLLALARTRAFLHGRDYVTPADVKRLAPDVLQHRLVRTVRAEAEGVTSRELVLDLLRHTPTP
jgi:MoxR-like ATPase